MNIERSNHVEVKIHPFIGCCFVDRFAGLCFTQRSCNTRPQFGRHHGHADQRRRIHTNRRGSHLIAGSQTPTATFTPLPPTNTPTPTLSPTPIFTFTPLTPQISVSVATNCRAGPGKAYDRVGALLVGEFAQVVGRNPTGNYWYIRNPDSSTGFCWVWGEYATLS